MSDKLRTLLAALADKTERGKYSWESLDDDTFRLGIAGGLIRINRGQKRVPAEHDYDFLPAFWVTVTNDSGRIIEEAEVLEEDIGYATVSRVLQAARRNVFQTDQWLDDMLNAVNSPK